MNQTEITGLMSTSWKAIDDVYSATFKHGFVRSVVWRGWGIALVVLCGTGWVLLQGFHPSFLIIVGGLSLASGYWSGRIINCRGYAVEHFGILKDDYDRRVGGLSLTWLAVGLGALTNSMISGTWRHAIATILVWWGGVLAATVVDARGQRKFESLVDSLPMPRRMAAIGAARKYADGPTFSVRNLYPKLISVVSSESE